MRDRRRSRPTTVLAWLARLAALMLPLALVLWYYLVRDTDERIAPEPPPRAAPVTGPVPETIPETIPRIPRLPAPAPLPPPLARPLPGAKPEAVPSPGAIAAVERRVAGRLAADRPRTEPLVGQARVRALEVHWDDLEGQPLLRVDEAIGLLAVGALYTGDVEVSGLVLTEPEAFLKRGEGEDLWNYERVLEEILGAARGPGPAPPARRIVILDGTLRDGRVVVQPPGGEITFDELDARVPRTVLSGPEVEGPEVEVTDLSTTVALPRRDLRFRAALDDGSFRFPEDRILFEVGRLAFGESVVRSLAGTYRVDGPGLGLEATARAERLAFDDVRFLVPDLPPGGTARFDLEIAPLPDERTAVGLADLIAEADESRAVGAIRVAVGGPAGFRLLAVDLRLEPLTIATLERFTGPLPYAGRLTGWIQGTPEALVFDVTGRLTTPAVAEPFRTELSGRATLGDEGFAIASLDVELTAVPLAALRPLAPALPLEGVATGRVSVRGPPGRVPLQLDLTLQIAVGIITVAGTLDLTGPVPAYDLSGRLVGIRLDEILEPEVPPVALTARFALAGRGVDPRRALATLRLAGGFTGWAAAPTDTVLVRAAVENGTLTVEAAALSLASLDLSVSGTWRFTEPTGGRLDYRVAVDPIDPFVPYLPGLREARVAGSLRTAGTVTGSIDRPGFAGELDGTGLRYAGWAAAAIEAQYGVVIDEPFPDIRLRLVADSMVTPGQTYDSASVVLVVAEPLFELEVLAAREEDARVIELAVDGRLEADGRREVFLRRLILDLDDERWMLAGPAMIRWGEPDGLEIRRFVFVEADGDGRVRIDGPYPLASDEEFRVEIAALPLGPLLALAGQDTLVSGDLYAEIRAIGPPGAPRVGGDFRVIDGTFREVALSLLEGSVLYEDERLDTRATAVLDTVGTAALEASAPVRIALEGIPSIELLDEGSLRASLIADSLPLTAVEAATPQVRDAEGLLQARVFVTGTPARPRLDGAVVVRDGAATFPALNQRYEEISADIVLADGVATVRGIRARSDGRAVATGVIRFDQPTNPTLDLLVSFEEFRAIGVEDLDDAAAWGELRISGTLEAPVVTGDLRLDDGNLPVPTRGEAELEEEILLADGNGFDLDRGDALGGVAEPAPWFDRVRIEELVVEFGENLWLFTEEARLQLSGELVLEKPGEDLLVFGTLSGERGTFTLQVGPVVRRFDIKSATVRFFGSPEPNPALDVTASRVVLGPAGERIEILVQIDGTLDAPTVAVTTADGAAVPESELLSFLLFGRPSFTLEEGPIPARPFLEEAIFGVGSLAELASIELEETLVADLGLPLDYFQIRPVPGPYGGFGAPTVVFGRELADDVFLTVDAGLATFFGASTAPASVWSATLEWRIDPEWSLKLGVEPVNTGRVFRGVGAALPVTSIDRQFIVELRRRWTY